MPRRTQKLASINGITIGYGGEPSAFAREIQIIFTRARNKAIADLRKKIFSPLVRIARHRSQLALGQKMKMNRNSLVRDFLGLFDNHHKPAGHR